LLCPNLCPTSAESQFKVKFEANFDFSTHPTSAKQQQ